MCLTIFNRPEYRHSCAIGGGAADIVTAAAYLDLGAPRSPSATWPQFRRVTLELPRYARPSIPVRPSRHAAPTSHRSRYAALHIASISGCRPRPCLECTNQMYNDSPAQDRHGHNYWFELTEDWHSPGVCTKAKVVGGSTS